ncbi:hypothetical protein L1987_85899 [Smallanthus sonchifolius]|uniref:Uncharacterized protein n=1 Tax=Smallanthus sonchifolius TaxID=185202 RepID=A0ACB8XZE4_9ASTR|nr:hypothetical protein L1987_85899 [Smallanthus sonchifolius]
MVTQQIAAAMPGITARVNASRSVDNENTRDTYPRNANPMNVNLGNTNTGGANPLNTNQVNTNPVNTNPRNANLGDATQANTGNPRNRGINYGYQEPYNPNGMRRIYTYDDFMECRPKELYGRGGATAALRWLEEIDSVINISNCTDNSKVKFTSQET